MHGVSTRSCAETVGRKPRCGGSFRPTRTRESVCLLGHLFQGNPAELPCGDGTVQDAANLVIFDANDDGGIDLSDAIYVLAYLFSSGGPAPVQGAECIPAEGCPAACSARD